MVKREDVFVYKYLPDFSKLTLVQRIFLTEPNNKGFSIFVFLNNGSIITVGNYNGKVEVLSYNTTTNIYSDFDTISGTENNATVTLPHG